ncbi:MAG: energy transducer TonB [Candidatus Goldbacteria bacterium]|nr:energy transducer TonB [Candidatus Goldiibacteriota bacterium]
MKSKKIVSLIAFIISLFMHGLIFSVPAYIYYIKYLKSDKVILQNFEPIHTVDAELLPDIKLIGNKSIIKKNSAEKKEKVKNQMIGISENNSYTSQEGVITDSEMLIIYDYIKRKIQENKKYPYQARKENIEGVVEIQFSISGDGMLKNINIIKSSGFTILDEEAIATIKRAAPYPEIKNRLNINNLQLQVKLIYKIE